MYIYNNIVSRSVFINNGDNMYIISFFNKQTTYCFVREIVNGPMDGLVRFNISQFSFCKEEVESLLSVGESFVYIDNDDIDNIKIVNQSEIMRYFESIVMKLRESVKRNVIESNLDSGTMGETYMKV